MGEMLPPEDPRGLIAEAFGMEGLGAAECRSIFLDWALGRPETADAQAEIRALLARFGASGHPMAGVLREGLTQSPRPSQPPRARGAGRGRRRG